MESNRRAEAAGPLDPAAGRAAGPSLEHPARRGRLLLALGIAVVAILLAWGIISRWHAASALERNTAQDAVPTVAVMQPQHAAPVRDLVLPGSLQAYLDTPIYARTSGYLSKWYVDIGTHVKRGQLLADIETPEVDEQLRQARSDLSNARANYLLADSTAARWTEMLKTQSVSQQETDEKVSDRLAKKASYDAAQHNVGRLEKLQSFQKIYAPFDGVVTARNTDVGALIDAGSGSTARELFHLADDTRMRVYVNVPQEFARQIHDGLPADLVLNELPGKRFHGVTVRSAGAVDPVERTLLVEVSVDNADGQLLPGEYAQVHFALRDAQPALLLPGNTLLFRPQGVRVAVVGNDNKIKLMPVVLGTDYGTRVAIASGLTGHERVVLNPPDSIVDGQAVRIAPPRASGAASASGASASAASPGSTSTASADSASTSAGSAE